MKDPLTLLILVIYHSIQEEYQSVFLLIETQQENLEKISVTLQYECLENN